MDYLLMGLIFKILRIRLKKTIKYEIKKKILYWYTIYNN